MVTYDHYSEYLKINFGNSTELHRRITRTLTLDKVKACLTCACLGNSWKVISS